MRFFLGNAEELVKVDEKKKLQSAFPIYSPGKVMYLQDIIVRYNGEDVSVTTASHPTPLRRLDVNVVHPLISIEEKAITDIGKFESISLITCGMAHIQVQNVYYRESTCMA